jgi:hypothetical protein
MIGQFGIDFTAETYSRLLRRGADIISSHLDGLGGNEDKLLTEVLCEIGRRPEFERWRRNRRPAHIGVAA